MRSALCLGLLLWSCLGRAAPVLAQLKSTGEGYALVVGSNLGGPGQAKLRYAESDTERVREVLVSLGGYAPDRVERLVQPNAEQLLAALDRVREKVTPLSEQGVQSRFFFYYSGHARADALNLADSQLPLAELRARIEALPATLAIVVLDACQSGAFSRPKGAARAADFSWNSVERLNTAGMAVIASSNERELSQESDELRGSYFTHHWLTALRGGGDHNHDGRVTLSEAYQYAYNHTLAQTAETAVGEQHVTLETNLRGQDDVPLTQPAAASARLRIPAEVEGRVLVQVLPSWSVLAELNKPRGESVLLALPAGDYAVTLRSSASASASRCSLRLRDGAELQLEPQRCPVLQLTDAPVKGEPLEETPQERRARLREERLAERRLQREREDAEDQYRRERVTLNLGMGVGWVHGRTRYLDTLRDFGFDGNTNAQLRFTGSLGYRLAPNLVLGLAYHDLAAKSYVRDYTIEQRFSFTGHALHVYAQADVGVGRRRMVNFFARLGLGASIAWTNFEAVSASAGFPEQNLALENTSAPSREVTQHYVRPCGYLSGGLEVTPGRYVGFFVEVRYVVAPALRNEFHEIHDLGGTDLFFGVRARTWE